MKGSGKAAFKLAHAYDEQDDPDNKELFWMTISAENGYPAGMYSLGFDLQTSDDSKNKIRARYWLKKAQKAGESSAGRLLKEMDR